MLDSQDKPGQAGTFEITCGMAEAGVTALEWFRESFDDHALVVAVYSAMRRREGQGRALETAKAIQAHATSDALQDEREFSEDHELGLKASSERHGKCATSCL